MKNILYCLLCFCCCFSCSDAAQTTTSITEITMRENLRKNWNSLMGKLTTDQRLIETSWNAIEKKYTQKNRAYHNLTHIDNMLKEATKFDQQIEDREVLLLAIWFHDIVYDPLSKDNELKSAEFAKRILKQTNLSEERIEKCYQQILLTVKHQPHSTAPLDDKLLIDFDLEILSRDWAEYKIYSGQVRKEYWMYPKPLFKSGRKKAMGKFLERATIYQTPFYQNEKEAKARTNIKREMEELL